MGDKQEAGKIAKEEAVSALKAAKAAITNFEDDMKSAEKELLYAKGKKQSFADGASASYSILKDKATPAPEPVQPEAPAGSEEAGQIGVSEAALSGATN